MSKYYGAVFESDSDLKHYGRKGMKRGMSIFGDGTYQPIGEKAQGQPYQTQLVIGKDNPLARAIGAANTARQNAANAIDEAKSNVSRFGSSLVRDVKQLGSDAAKDISNRASSVMNAAKEKAQKKVNQTVQKAVYGGKSEAQIRGEAARLGAQTQSAKDYQKRQADAAAKRASEDRNIQVVRNPFRSEAEYRQAIAKSATIANSTKSKKQKDAETAANAARIEAEKKAAGERESRKSRLAGAKQATAEHRAGRSLDAGGIFKEALEKHSNALKRANFDSIDPAKRREMMNAGQDPSALSKTDKAKAYASAAGETGKRLATSVKNRASDAAKEVGTKAKNVAKNIGDELTKASTNAYKSRVKMRNNLYDVIDDAENKVNEFKEKRQKEKDRKEFYKSASDAIGDAGASVMNFLNRKDKNNKKINRH